MLTTDQKIDRLVTGFEEFKGGFKKLEKSVGGLQESVGRLEVRVGGLEQKVGGLEKTVGGLCEESRSLRRDVDHLIEVVIDVKSTTEHLDGRVARLEVSHGRAFNKMDEFLVILNRHDIENVALRSTTDRLAERVGKLEKARIR